MILKILTYGNSKLNNKSVPVKEISDDIVSLANDMMETMKESSGWGLAAPQVGFNIRLITVSVDDSGDIIMVNPVITEQNDSMTSNEACLSVPGISGDVDRYKEITVEYTKIDGTNGILEGVTGDLSRCIQHEIDHLDGILYVDKLVGISKMLVPARLKKLKRKLKK